jgi:hypothetical protein
MLELHPEFLSKNGQKEFAVLPYEEFLKIQEILEDWEDLMALRSAKQSDVNAQTISLDEAKKLLLS